MSKVIIMESKADQSWSALIYNELPKKDAHKRNKAFQEAQRQKTENDNNELL